MNFLNSDSCSLVESFKKSFLKAGWPMPYDSDLVAGWQKDGIWIGPVDVDNKILKGVIEDVTGLLVQFFPDVAAPDRPKEVNLLIGV